MSQHPSTAARPGVTAPAAFTDRRAGSLGLQEGLALTALTGYCNGSFFVTCLKETYRKIHCDVLGTTNTSIGHIKVSARNY